MAARCLTSKVCPPFVFLCLLAMAFCGWLGRAVSAGGAAPAQGSAALGYINALPPEPEAARQARQARVAARRSDDRTVIMVHRGASRFAPENSLEAYSEAMARGADGVEIDIRRSADGVLYLFHDDTLDRMVQGRGKVKDKTYYELVSLPFSNDKGHARARIPTLIAFLVLAREQAILIHLDVKEPGLQDELIRLFDEADMWTHLVEVNGGNAERIRNHPRVQLRQYIGWFPETDDPQAHKSFMERPGNMVFLKHDPTPAVEYLGRTPPDDPGVATLPDSLRAVWHPDGTWKPLGEPNTSRP